MRSPSLAKAIAADIASTLSMLISVATHDAMVENDILDKVLLWIAIALESRDADTAEAAAVIIMTTATSMASRKLDIDSAKSVLTSAIKEAGDDADNLLDYLTRCCEYHDNEDLQEVMKGFIEELQLNAKAGELIQHASLLFQTSTTTNPDENEWVDFCSQHRPKTRSIKRAKRVLTSAIKEAGDDADNLLDYLTRCCEYHDNEDLQEVMKGFITNISKKHHMKAEAGELIQHASLLFETAGPGGWKIFCSQHKTHVLANLPGRSHSVSERRGAFEARRDVALFDRDSASRSESSTGARSNRPSPDPVDAKKAAHIMKVSNKARSALSRFFKGAVENSSWTVGSSGCNVTKRIGDKTTEPTAVFENCSNCNVFIGKFYFGKSANEDDDNQAGEGHQSDRPGSNTETD